MNRIATVLTFAAVLAFSGAATCNKTNPTEPANPVVAGVINCAEDGVHNVAINLIDDVASALATGDYVSGLVALVKQFGEAAVDCAVSEVGTTSNAHASMNQLEADKAKRAKAWLASRNVTFARRELPFGPRTALAGTP